MYIPLAVHKNELLEIDDMMTFSHYFCLAKKQRMTPLTAHAAPAHEEENTDGEEKTYYGDVTIDVADEDDDL